MTFRTCLRKVFKIYKNGLESKLDGELSRNESQIETYFDSVCISKGFMNSQSGQIFGISGVSAVLSEENLQEVLSLLANE